MTDYSRDELLSERNKLQISIANMEVEKTRALDDKRIEVSDFRLINGEQLSLENTLNQYNIALANEGFDSISVPGSQLKESVDNLNEAISTIEEVGNLLSVIAQVIDEINKLIGAILRLRTPV
ncbi:MAG: hypothetical protein F6K31_41105 [Symploca sp. SIO2G7]|nr:hypothetical protein [Symploca sp. SIO2G7]